MNLKITVFLEKLGQTEGEQVAQIARFLRDLADEMEEHERFGSGANPCYLDNAIVPIGEFHIEFPNGDPVGDDDPTYGLKL